jgi:hypothetical protein
MQIWVKRRMRTAGQGKALRVLCVLLFACVAALGGCTGPGLEPPGARGNEGPSADAGALGPMAGGQGGKGSQDSGGGVPASGSGGSATGSTDAGVGLIDAGKDAGMDDEDAGTLR